MKKALSIIVLGFVFMGGLIFTLNQLNNSQDAIQVAESQETVSYNGPKLHWFHEDKYPTAEEQEKFYFHKGQFPLETAELINQR